MMHIFGIHSDAIARIELLVLVAYVSIFSSLKESQSVSRALLRRRS